MAHNGQTRWYHSGYGVCVKQNRHAYGCSMCEQRRLVMSLTREYTISGRWLGIKETSNGVPVCRWFLTGTRDGEHC